METRVASATKEVAIGPEYPTVLVGERINRCGNESQFLDGHRAAQLGFAANSYLATSFAETVRQPFPVHQSKVVANRPLT